jgi:hypothetical protein
METKDPGNGKIERQIFVLEKLRQIKDPTTKFSGRIKTLIFDQNGFYFNGNTMKIDDMKGDYRHHRFWSSGMYYVHAGTEFKVEGKNIKESKKNAVVYIRSKDNPEIYVHIREIEDFINIDVSR